MSPGDQTAAPSTSEPVKMPAFHRGMRLILVLNVIAPWSILVIGFLGVALLLLAVCASMVMFAITLVCVLRSPKEPKLWPCSALALAIFFCSRSIYIDLNPFTPVDSSSHVYEGQPALWLAIEMLAILMGVWAFRIWNDFIGVFGRVRAITAATCAVFLFLMSQNGPKMDAGRRSYDVTSTFYHEADGKQFGSELNQITDHRQVLYHSQGFYMAMLLFTATFLTVTSWRPRWKTRPRELEMQAISQPAA